MSEWPEAEEPTPEDQTEDTRTCVFCAGIHDIVSGIDAWAQPCPRIKKIERSPAGALLSVEFWPPGQWESRVEFLSDILDEEETYGSSA